MLSSPNPKPLPERLRNAQPKTPIPKARRRQTFNPNPKAETHHNLNHFNRGSPATQNLAKPPRATSCHHFNRAQPTCPENASSPKPAYILLFQASDRREDAATYKVVFFLFFRARVARNFLAHTLRGQTHQGSVAVIIIILPELWRMIP